MTKRAIYRDSCPKGSLVNPRKCSSCKGLDAEGTFALWRARNWGFVICNETSKIEIIRERGELEKTVLGKILDRLF